MLIVKMLQLQLWLWEAFLLLVLIGSSFSLQCEYCDGKTACKEKTCDKSEIHCVAAFHEGKVYKGCKEDEDVKSCNIPEGGCATDDCSMSMGRALKEETRICACSTDNCNRGDFKTTTQKPTDKPVPVPNGSNNKSASSKPSSAQRPSSQVCFVFGSVVVVFFVRKLVVVLT